MYIANILAKEGYFGGNPQTILNTDGGIVLDNFHYEMFFREYDNALYYLNKEKK